MLPSQESDAWVRLNIYDSVFFFPRETFCCPWQIAKKSPWNSKIARGKLGFQKLPVKHAKLPVANLAKSCPWNLKIARGKSEKSSRETSKLPVANSGFFLKNLVISKLLPALETRLFDQPPSPGSNFENTMVKSKKAPFPKLTFSRGESNFSQYHAGTGTLLISY